MKIVAKYNFNGGKEYVEKNYFYELQEIEFFINSVDASICKTKISKEKTMNGKKLYSPAALNTAFKKEFSKNKTWSNHKIFCDYSFGEYLPNYEKTASLSIKPFRDIDFIKKNRKLGVEVQFGKYAFMVYNVCAKMTIFNKLGIIDAGIEIVPVKKLANEMSTGVCYFEQFAWD